MPKSETIEMTPVESKATKPVSRAQFDANVLNCRKALGKTNEWGADARARLTKQAETFGITLNFGS